MRLLRGLGVDFSRRRDVRVTELLRSSQPNVEKYYVAQFDLPKSLNCRSQRADPSQDEARTSTQQNYFALNGLKGGQSFQTSCESLFSSLPASQIFSRWSTTNGTTPLVLRWLCNSKLGHESLLPYSPLGFFHLVRTLTCSL